MSRQENPRKRVKYAHEVTPNFLSFDTFNIKENHPILIQHCGSDYTEKYSRLYSYSIALTNAKTLIRYLQINDPDKDIESVKIEVNCNPLVTFDYIEGGWVINREKLFQRIEEIYWESSISLVFLHIVFKENTTKDNVVVVYPSTVV